MWRRYLLFTLPMIFGFWTFFALYYYAHLRWSGDISTLISQPCYLFEDVVTPLLFETIPRPERYASFLTQSVLVVGFVLWASLLTLPFWLPSPLYGQRRIWLMILCWSLAGNILILSLGYMIYTLLLPFEMD